MTATRTAMMGAQTLTLNAPLALSIKSEDRDPLTRSTVSLPADHVALVEGVLSFRVNARDLHTIGRALIEHAEALDISANPHPLNPS